MSFANVKMDQVIASIIGLAISALAAALFRLTFLIAKLLGNNMALHRDQQRLCEAFEGLRKVVAGLRCVNPLDPGLCPLPRPTSDTDFHTPTLPFTGEKQ